MKTGRSFDDLRDEVKRQTETKRDFIASSPTLNLDASGQLMQVGELGGFGLTKHAHRQIGQKLNIPAKYYDRMAETCPDLLAENVNRWLNMSTDKRMVRTLDDRIRAFVSNKYRRLDNFDLIEAVLPTLEEGNANIVSCEVTEKYLYLKAIMPDNRFIIPRQDGGTPDDVQAGITIRNSEVGASTLQVSPALHTTKCTNLAVWSNRSLRRFHLGEKVNGDSDTWEYMSDETKAVTDAAVWMQVRDLVSQSIHGDLYQNIVDDLTRARSNEIEGDVVEVVEEILNPHRLTDQEVVKVRDNLIRENDLTQYGIHAAVTRMSQEVKGYERASELETIGAEIIELPNNQWESIAKAA